MLEDFREKLKGVYLQKVKGECVFCRIIEEDEKVIYTGENIAVFPPLKSGALKEAHLLVVPKKHVENMFEMDSQQVEDYFREMQEFIQKVEEESRFAGVNLLSANGKAAQQSIKHLHFHAVFREESEDYDLWPETDYAGEYFEEVNNELENLF